MATRASKPLANHSETTCTTTCKFDRSLARPLARPRTTTCTRHRSTCFEHTSREKRSWRNHLQTPLARHAETTCTKFQDHLHDMPNHLQTPLARTTCKSGSVATRSTEQAETTCTTTRTNHLHSMEQPLANHSHRPLARTTRNPKPLAN